MALLYAEYMGHDMSHQILDAVKCGGSHKVAAEAGGLTSKELSYIFELAEAGHPGYREFRDEYFHHRSMRVMTISEAQIRRAVSDDGTIADRRYALELIEPETFKEEPSSSRAPAGGAFQANQFTFNVQTSWDDDDKSSSNDDNDVAVDAAYEEVEDE